MSSPPFPRYKGYNEVATGTAGGTAGGSGRSNFGPLPTKVKARERDISAALAIRPKQQDLYPSRYPSVTKVDNWGFGGSNQDWLSSEVGRYYLRKHQVREAPTQTLSLECQKRKFNPDFHTEMVNQHAYRCRVKVRDITVSCTGTFDNILSAKQDAAYKALRIVREWPVPPLSNPLFYIAQFSGQISDDAVHSRLRQILKGRKYTLSAQRYPGMSGGYLLLQIPQDPGFPMGIIRLDGGLESVVFMKHKKADYCNLCAKTALKPHARIHCPLWQTTTGAYPGRMVEPTKVQRNDLPQRLVKAEPEKGRNNNTTLVKHAADSIDKQAQLIRSIQDVMGTSAGSGESKDPKVKAAFLEGIALGARLAATAPGNAANAERRRTRSRTPEGPELRRLTTRDYWRNRSPMRERQRSRERGFDRGPDRGIDRGVEPRQSSQPAANSSRGRLWGAEAVGVGSSRWGKGDYYR